VATLDTHCFVIQNRITVTTSTIRDLRNHFPKVRKLVETEGEVLLTERGKPRYRLSLYTPAHVGTPAAVDYWARLTAYQPQVMTEAQARALHEENRGDR
jgi:antitoxin (DNA-binding transcriptional repressor) of toxin-antitoxin stability system